MPKVLKGADRVTLDARGVLHVEGLEVDAEAVELEQAHAALLASVNMVLNTHMAEFNKNFAAALAVGEKKVEVNDEESIRRRPEPAKRRGGKRTKTP